jgi:hypothetical protein
MNKALMLNEIKKHLGLVKDSEFASYLNISTTTLSNWYGRNTFNIQTVYTKCDFINPSWLITGEGNMLKNQKNDKIVTSTDNPSIIYLVDRIERLSAENAKLKFELELLKQHKPSKYHIAAEQEG